MDEEKIMMTSNREDYLKSIEELQRRHGTVNNRLIADRLEVSPASVSEMLQKLAKEGLVEVKPERNVVLTEEGKKKALQLLRIHRLWEVFLVDHLGYAWSEVHEEAERLEHASSLLLAERLDHFLDYPRRCPHGGAIPGGEGNVSMQKLYRLVDLPVGVRAVIRRVPERRDLLELLSERGICLNEMVAPVESEGLESGILLELSDGRRTALPSVLADSILVSFADERILRKELWD